MSGSTRHASAAWQIDRETYRFLLERFRPPFVYGHFLCGLPDGATLILFKQRCRYYCQITIRQGGQMLAPQQGL